MIRITIKLIGKRVSGCWGRVNTKKLKRQANKATRKFKQQQEKDV